MLRAAAALRRPRALAALGAASLFGLRLAPAPAAAASSLASPQAPPAPAAATSTPPRLPTVVLYQYESCPFCNKVRAYLDWRRIPDSVVEVDPLFKGALAFSEYKKVPLAVIDGVAVPDSTAIIDALEARLRAAGAIAPAAAAAPAAAVDPWRAWSDAVLVKHLTVNIYRSWPEALQTFDYLTQRNFPAWSAAAAKYIGAAAMVAVAGKRRKELGVAPAQGAERAALAAVLGELEGGLAGRPFLGGAAAGLGDVSCYGVLRSIRALPTYTEAVLGHPGAAAWCARMEGAVGGSMLQHRVGEKA